MSQQPIVDATQTIIHHDDEPTRPPPKLEVGIVGWMRQYLFGSPADVIVTVIASVLILILVLGFFDWTIGSANWFTIINNQRLFMIQSFEPEFEWRIALTVLVSALLTGVSLAAWARRSVRGLTGVSLGVLVALALLPPLIEATIPQPSSFVTAGNVEIRDRASTINPQRDLAFIAQAGETVSLRLALDEVANIRDLSQLAGFSDRATNALANAARNRLEQQVVTGDTFDQMRSGELTEGLEERTRLNIRTLTRTNDMLASTEQYVTRIAGRLTAPDGTVAELRLWLERLERAARGLDPREAAILEALETVEDGTVNLSVTDTVPADLHASITHLTTVTLASDQLEDLGETLVVQLSEDFIGEPDQRDDQEELLKPSARESEFLRDLFVRLLTPQSVLDLYELGATPMAVAVRDANSLDVLADGVLGAAEDVVSLVVPADGWYILTKDAAADETGTAILAAQGIYPIVERTLSATESRFVRLTDNDLVITESRPMLDGENVPFVVLIDNQYRGLRDLQTYLVHYIPPFFKQMQALLLPFFITVVWGYLIGRVSSHMLGENSVFNSGNNRSVVVALALTPLLILLLYFALLDGAGAIVGLPGIVLKLVASFGVVWLARRVENWLNAVNRGDAAEGSINRLLGYAWGVFPFAMYVMASGAGGLSGATLGSIVGGLIWLLLMYFIGLNFRGSLGYALLLAGFFAQIVQAAAINLVWDGWTSDPISSLAIWLVVAAVGVIAGIRGAGMRHAIDMSVKRYGYLVCSIVFVFVILDTNTLSETADSSTALLAGAAMALWLGWMFFTGATRWSSNRVIAGLLLLTFLWMQAWTLVDRWSTVYFIIWLVIGALAFKRGEKAQAEKQKL